ncbi:energy transducer TonB [Archangium sp.]|uniref:energy transducer TonB n=1 Tax=Archangium sp. TaxID=1872627 RepID=UPI00389ABB3A
MSLFRLGEPPAGGGEGQRWGWAVVLAALVHAGLILAFWAAPAVSVRAPTAPPEEPEVVFFSFPPPPPAAAQASASRAPGAERVRRQARLHSARPALVLPAKVPVPERPVETPAEEASEPAPEPEPSEPANVGGEPAGTEGVGGVVAGLVGGVLGGREGGRVGATGGSALEVTQVARAPEVLERVQPRYPRRARADGIEGLVLVRVIIGIDGRIEPEHTRVVRSVPGLDAAALSAVGQWRFTPALGHQGRPVRVIVEIPVQFSLK